MTTLQKRFRARTRLLIGALVVLNLGCNSKESTETRSRVSSLESDVKKIDELRSELATVRSDLSEVRAQLARTLPPEPISRIAFTIDDAAKDDPFLGQDDSPLVMMAFTSYDCLKCAEFAQVTLPLIRHEFIETGKLKYLHRDFVTPSQTKGAEYSRFADCAGEQGVYWKAHDELVQNRIAEDSSLPALVSLGLTDTKKFSRCNSGTRYEQELTGDIAAGKALDVKGVPTFFLGRKLPGGGYDGVRIRGAQPVGVFRREIAKLLDSKSN